MRTAYLVLSHHKPEQVEDLADRVLELSSTAHVVVHHDARGDPLPWKGDPPERAHLVDASRVLWGDWSFVEALLRMLRFARDALQADWFALISGEDRPVVDLAAWERHLETSEADAVLTSSEIGKLARLGRRASVSETHAARYRFWWLALPPMSNRAARRLMMHLTAVGQHTHPVLAVEYFWRRDRWFVGVRRPRRAVPAGWRFCTGPCWMALGRRAAEAVLEADDGVIRHYRRTLIPDESFFHSVLANTPGLEVSTGRLLSYVPWEKGAARDGLRFEVRGTNLMSKGGLYLRAEDFDAIQASGAPFARKFDRSFDSGFIQMVDESVDRSRSAVEAPARGSDQSRE
jgi:hypothetical protein